MYLLNSKGKGKVHPRTCREGPEGAYRDSSTLSLTSALDGSAPRPGRFSHRKEGLGGLQGQFGRMRKISPPPGFDPRTVQPVASRCTECVMAARIL